jgi:hypothetical protein
MIIHFLPADSNKSKTRPMIFEDLKPGDLFVWDDCLFITTEGICRTDGRYICAIDITYGTALTDKDINSDSPVKLVSRTKSFDIREDELIDIVYIGAD